MHGFMFTGSAGDVIKAVLMIAFILWIVIAGFGGGKGNGSGNSNNSSSSGSSTPPTPPASN